MLTLSEIVSSPAEQSSDLMFCDLFTLMYRMQCFVWLYIVLCIHVSVMRAIDNRYNFHKSNQHFNHVHVSLSLAIDLESIFAKEILLLIKIDLSEVSCMYARKRQS